MFVCSESVGCDPHARALRLALFGVGSALPCAFILHPHIAADPMRADPNGFYGFQWGTLLADVQDLIEVESGEHVQAYELKHGLPKVADVLVDSLRFVTFDGQFTRVMIHYHGSQPHSPDSAGSSIRPHRQDVGGHDARP